jgi:glutamyl-tRNA synthetase
MILGADKARLSKRHGATSVTAYREQGYLPEALVNYLARLGWSAGDQEIFSRGELSEKFDLAQGGTAPAVFNPEKLVWLNAHYIKEAERGRLGDLLAAFLPPRETWPADAPDPAAAAQAHKERSRTLVEMAESVSCCYKEEISIDEASASKHLTASAAVLLGELADRIEKMSEFTAPALETLQRPGLREGRGRPRPAVPRGAHGQSREPGDLRRLPPRRPPAGGLPAPRRGGPGGGLTSGRGFPLTTVLLNG